MNGGIAANVATSEDPGKTGNFVRGLCTRVSKILNGVGWGVRPADGRSRTLPGTLGEGARHRASRDRCLYGYLSHYGRSPERMPARKKPCPPVSPRPLEFRLRFRDCWPSPNRWWPARGFEERKQAGDCPACPPHARPSAVCEVLLFWRRRYQELKLAGSTVTPLLPPPST